MSELTDLAKESHGAPSSQRASLFRGAGRLIALKELTAINAFQRDQGRLNQRNRAAYKKLGMDVEDEDTIQNILGDVTISANETSESSKSESRKGAPGWMAALIAAAAGAAGGAAAAQMLPDVDRRDPPPAVVEDEGQIGYRLELE